jgi:protein-disulfide isomerase
MSLRPLVSKEDHMQGNPDAPIELLEYGDYQCPYCGRAYPIIKKLQLELGDKMKFIFRNFPLATVHPQAMLAAMASEAAALQGKYWPMHDMLFENQRRLFKSAIMGYAEDLSLDLDKFGTDIRDEEIQKAIELQFYGGMRSGVNATPGLFINGEKLNSGWEGDELSKFIRDKYPQFI